jgi:hypothetical protein
MDRNKRLLPDEIQGRFRAFRDLTQFADFTLPDG